MLDSSFFEFSNYHIALAVLGVSIIAARWLPRLFSNREPAAAPLLIMFGAVAVLLLPELSIAPDPRTTPVPWEIVTEICVIVALFGSGMRIDSLRPWLKWQSTIRMLMIAMPLTILATALLGMTMGGLTFASAVLLGAVLSPTDPVLAADVQVGPPQEGAEHPVRFTLTTEATLNDGLAFPFVYLAMLIAAGGMATDNWAVDWVAIDIIYRILVGTVMGWAGGRVLGFILFVIPKNASLAETGSGVIAIAGVFLCYGSTELVEGYGFIAVAIMGLTLRRVEETHHFHKRLHDFSESIEHALTALLLVALGTALPQVLSGLTWSVALLVVLLLVVVRPVTGWIALLRTNLPTRDRAIVSVYGVRGIGSIYYLSYAAAHGDVYGIDQLWTIVALCILASTVLHGFSVGWAMDKLHTTEHRPKTEEQA